MRLLGALLILAAFAVVGCNSEPEDGPPPLKMTQAQVDAQIAKINADPKMPESAKQMAINGVKMAFEQSQKAPPSGGPVPGK